LSCLGAPFPTADSFVSAGSLCAGDLVRLEPIVQPLMIARDRFEVAVNAVKCAELCASGSADES